MVINLEEARDVSIVGGKAAALGRLIEAGFNVPKGYVVAATEKIDAHISKEITEKYEALGADYVAVRSSATAEDGANDAWAGQFETFLNITREGLLDKVNECLESGKSGRAESYAGQKGLDTGLVAVIVQRMVQGDVSGVAFSVNPVSRNTDEIVIEAAYGLNEAVVSGEVTPDTYIVSKRSGEVLQAHVADQTKKLVLGEGGNQWKDIDDGSAQKLNDRQITEVANLTKKLEKHFGFSVDVEWTFADGKLYVLQSRPITTLG